MQPYSSRSKSADRRNVFVRVIAALVVAFALSVIPTPYDVIAPGSAVDLSTRLSVEGRSPPARRYYLTDVTIARASVLLLLAGLWPGVRIVRADTVVPPGESARGFDRVMIDAMGESQVAAAVVAERAAGYRVLEAPRRVVIVDLSPSSRAFGRLAAGDEVTAVAGASLRTPTDIARALRDMTPGSVVRVAFRRAGRPGVTEVATSAGPHGIARLGVHVRPSALEATLPVAVHYTIGDIAGSSGGLMFALEIFASLRPSGGHDPIAGTGTIGSDGRVGPIEGVKQKIIAAERAGATTFLVPRENYADVARERGIRVVPVATFAEAVAAIR